LPGLQSPETVVDKFRAFSALVFVKPGAFFEGFNLTFEDFLDTGAVDSINADPVLWLLEFELEFPELFGDLDAFEVGDGFEDIAPGAAGFALFVACGCAELPLLELLELD
jgi:hypothetical protein